MKIKRKLLQKLGFNFFTLFENIIRNKKNFYKLVVSILLTLTCFASDIKICHGMHEDESVKEIKTSATIIMRAFDFIMGELVEKPRDRNERARRYNGLNSGRGEIKNIQTQSIKIAEESNKLNKKLNICSSELTNIKATLRTRTTERDTCNSNLEICNTNLSGCNGYKASFEKDLLVCIQEKNNLNRTLHECNSNLNVCNTQKTTCNTNLTICTTERDTCNSNLGTSNTKLNTHTATLLRFQENQDLFLESATKGAILSVVPEFIEDGVQYMGYSPRIAYITSFLMQGGLIYVSSGKIPYVSTGTGLLVRKGCDWLGFDPQTSNTLGTTAAITTDIIQQILNPTSTVTNCVIGMTGSYVGSTVALNTYKWVKGPSRQENIEGLLPAVLPQSNNLLHQHIVHQLNPLTAPRNKLFFAKQNLQDL